MQALFDMFNASMAKLESGRAPSTLFEKFHILSLDWRVPIVASLLYTVLVSVFSRINRSRAALAGRSRLPAPKSGGPEFTPFHCVVIAHNLALCLYSLYTFILTIKILVAEYVSRGAYTAFCDVNGATYRAGVNFMVWHFYASKYYELTDTAILLLKGKQSSFLQTFHHSGSILGMWIMTITRAQAGWIFVLFNSFIHTIMYFYYTLTCFGFRPTWKQILTRAQIVQFAVGNPLGICYIFLPNCTVPEVMFPENIVAMVLGGHRRSLYACLAVNTVFISSLILLFNSFAKKTYGGDRASAPQGRASARKAMASLISPAKKPKRS